MFNFFQKLQMSRKSWGFPLFLCLGFESKNERVVE